MPSCTVCQSSLKQTWNYCPGCGETVHERKNDLLEALFSELYRRLDDQGIVLKREKALPKAQMQKYKEEVQAKQLLEQKKKENAAHALFATQNQMQLLNRLKNG